MFKKKEAGMPMEVRTPPPTRKGLLDKLRDRRLELVKETNDNDRRIAELDREITYLERHPGAEEVLAEFIGDQP